jgi:hypothetical protein
MKSHLKTAGLIVFALPVNLACAEAEFDKEQKAKSFLSFDIPKGLSFSLSEEDSKGTFGANFVQGSNIYGLSIAGKLKDNVGEFINLDGIDSNTKITGTWSRTLVSTPPLSGPYSVTFADTSANYAKFALKECELLNKDMKSDGLAEPGNCAKQQLLTTKLSTLTFSRSEALKVSRLAFDINKECKTYLQEPWAGKYEIDKMCETTNALYSNLQRGSNDSKVVITDFGVFSASISYFQTKFNWLDTENLTSINDRSLSATKDGFDITLSYSHVYATDLFKWEAGSSFQKGHSNDSANTERELCFNFDAEREISECASEFLLPPIEKETASFFLRLTKQFGEQSIFKSVGLDLKYTFEDAEKQDGSDGGLDRWTIETPLHLFTLMDKKISAGIKFSWVSEVRKNEDPFKTTFFVSAPLTVF